MNPQQQMPQGYPPQQPQQQYAPPIAPQQPNVSSATYMAPVQSKSWMITGIVFIATTVIFAGLGGWALFNYFDQRNTVDAQVDEAVAAAVKEQADADAAAYEEAEKEPNRQFVGPEDYGRVTFEYPKTWSLFVEEDASTGGDYTAYLNPGGVPPIERDQQYALRVIIEDDAYEDVIDDYQNRVEDGELTSSSFKVDDNTGTRLDGLFTDDIRGSAVVFKIRDKTVTLRTDATTFSDDFDKLIQTITFNK